AAVAVHARLPFDRLVMPLEHQPGEAGVGAEVRAVPGGGIRVLGGPCVGLRGGAGGQGSPGKEGRHDRDRRRTETAATFERLGDRRRRERDEGGLDGPEAARVLQQPPDLVPVGVGVGITGAATDEHDREVAGIVGADGGADALLGEREHERMDTERTPVLESHARMAASPAFERGGPVVLHVPGAEEDERDGADRGHAPGDERVGCRVEGGLGPLDEPAAHLEPVRLATQHVGELPVLLDPGGRAAAVADEEQRGARAHDAFPSGGSTERRTSALRAAAATALPPFSPTLEIAGTPLARRRAFDSAAPTNPTGRPTTRAGANAPHSARPTTSSRAVGAQPTTTLAPAGWHAAAARMPSALRVVPASPPVSGRWHSAWIPWMPCCTISTSQTTGAPARTAHTPASTTASST